MKARELQENLLNDAEHFSSEEHQRAIEALSKDLDAVQQKVFLIIVKLLKYIPKMSDKNFEQKVLTPT